MISELQSVLSRAVLGNQTSSNVGIRCMIFLFFYKKIQYEIVHKLVKEDEKYFSSNT